MCLGHLKTGRDPPGPTRDQMLDECISSEDKAGSKEGGFDCRPDAASHTLCHRGFSKQERYNDINGQIT